MSITIQTLNEGFNKRYLSESEVKQELNRKLKEERNPYGKIFFVVYELDEDGDEVEDIKAFSKKDVAIKFAQKQSFPTHVVLVPDFDPDDYGKEAERWITDTYGYGPFEVVWESDEESDDMIFEELDISTYIPLSTTETRGGKTYQFFRKLKNGKGKWAAVEICDGKQCGEPFAITYEQARGFEPINPTEKTSRILGKKLLPQRS